MMSVLLNRRQHLRAIALMLAGLLGAMMLPQPAAAQLFPCNGDGPGQRMVGMDNSTTPPTPLCQAVGSGQAPQPAAPIVLYGSLAWHRDADDVWVATGYSTKGQDQATIDACNAVMGGGCTAIGEWSNSYVSVVRDQNGGLFAGWGTTSRGSKKDASRECDKENVIPCLPIGTYWTEKYRARGPKTAAETRKRYAALAWLKEAEGYDRRAWIASGHVDGPAAKAKAVAGCQAANGGRECIAMPAVGNGFIQTYNLPSAGTHGDANASETTLERARKAALTQCEKSKAKCTLQQAYDSRVPGLFVHDFISGAAIAASESAPR
ncbi:DUF4189 domain-containing protein [Altererythrobacter sp. Z27]|uniref:DUF4189 domain-containing protein n=1 Tax=Altererythrobacter sp. Z27 TaxID=3461147 RepID=UPI0040446A59